MRPRLILISLTCVALSLLIFAGHRNSSIQGSNAAQQPHQVINAVEQSPPHVISPYDIERYINRHSDEADLDEIWSRLGITSDGGKPGKCGCRGYDCPGNCKAEVIQDSTTERKPGFVVLRICYAGGSACWFLLFKNEQVWKYVGIAESLDNQYKPPQHKIVEHQAEQWLVIKELWGRGTGFLQYGERWYDISDAGLRDVLSYPVSGHSVQGDAEDYELKSEVSDTKEKGNFTIDIRYTILSDGNHDSGLLWLSSREYNAHFIWDAVSKSFELDELNSKLPKSGNDPISEYIVRYRQMNRK